MWILDVPCAQVGLLQCTTSYPTILGVLLAGIERFMELGDICFADLPSYRACDNPPATIPADTPRLDQA